MSPKLNIPVVKHKNALIKINKWKNMLSPITKTKTHKNNTQKPKKSMYSLLHESLGLLANPFLVFEDINSFGHSDKLLLFPFSNLLLLFVVVAQLVLLLLLLQLVVSIDKQFLLFSWCCLLLLLLFVLLLTRLCVDFVVVVSGRYNGSPFLLIIWMSTSTPWSFDATA